MKRNWFRVIINPLYLMLLIIIVFLLILIGILPWPRHWICNLLEKLLTLIEDILEKLSGWISKACHPDDTKIRA